MLKISGLSCRMAAYSSLCEVEAKPLLFTTCSNPSAFEEPSLAHLPWGPGSECPSCAKGIDIIGNLPPAPCSHWTPMNRAAGAAK